MLISKWISNLKIVKLQRNYSLCLNAFLATVVLGLLLIMMLSANRHSTVLVPAGLTQQAIVGFNGVSDSYLIHWSDFIANLKLNVTPDTIKMQHQALLPHISSQSYGKFKAELDKELEKIVSDEISTIFFPKKTVAVDRDKHVVKTTGTLQVYIAETLHESMSVTYELRFDFSNNRLLLKSFTEVGRV